MRSSSIDCCVCMYSIWLMAIVFRWCEAPQRFAMGCAIVKKRKEKYNGGNKTWLIHDLPSFKIEISLFFSIDRNWCRRGSRKWFFREPIWSARMKRDRKWMDVCVGAVNLNSLTQKRFRNIAGVPKGRKADANLPGMFKSDMGDVYESESASRTQWVVIYMYSPRR